MELKQHLRSKKYTIETKNLYYHLPSAPSLWSFLSQGRHCPAILADVTCEARPGELTAIVGPSGAGKTTLLTVIAGMVQPGRVTGRVLVNGRDMEPARFRRVSGYVTQDDVLFPLLTVYETLAYSARLRVGSDRGRARVGEIVKELGLEKVAHARVGSSAGGRGVSGGERRRVSIGVELVHEPAVLLLDEPTSGLDSASALHVVELLESMATLQGKTVILTIHQPGFRILDLFSRLILLCSGTVRHNASLELLEHRLKVAGCRVPDHVNVLEFAMDAVSTLTPDHPPPESSASSTPLTAIRAGNDRPVYANTPAQEILTLSERAFKNVLRSNQLFAARVLQSTLAGVGLGTVFMNATDARSRLGFFAFTLTFLLTSTTEGLPVFLRERAILMHETARGAYRISSYVVSIALVFAPLLLLISLLYAFPVYWMVGLRRELDGFLYFALVAWMVVAMANSLVSFFSAVAPDYIMGNTLIAGVLGGFFLFSGYFIASEDIPKYWIVMHYLSMFKYPFEALLVSEYGVGSAECLRRAGDACALDGRMFLRQQGLEGSCRWVNLGVMLCFVVGYRVLCYLMLKLRCRAMR